MHLEVRKPEALWRFVGWALAGPLNPLVVALFALEIFGSIERGPNGALGFETSRYQKDSLYNLIELSTMLLLPASFAAALVALRTPARIERSGKIAAEIIWATVWAAPLAGFLFFLPDALENGLAELTLATIAAVVAAAIGLPIAVLVALGPAIFAFLSFRFLTFRTGTVTD